MASAVPRDPAEPPFFSVVTVVFNDLSGLKASRQSLKAQSCGDWEWIVVDGASRDGTAEYVRELKHECAWSVSEPDAGIYDAMNKATRHAKGHYILFLNAGDLMASATALADVKGAILSRSGGWADMIFGATLQAFSPGSRVLRRPKPADYLWHGLPAFHQSILLRREACSLPLYDTNYRLLADYDLVARMYRRGCSWQTVDVPVSVFFVGGRSYSRRFHALAESWRLQRDMLRSPAWLRAVSFARGTTTYIVSVLLSRAASVLDRVGLRRHGLEAAEGNGESKL